jgi:type II secretory pathway pseudopilin PulG
MQQPPHLAHRNPKDDPRPNPESGIVLLMVVFLTFLMLLALAIAAPEWAKSFQRQKELETIHRGQQYERAIQLYYRQFHRYPNTVKELLHTNNIRFLRKQYKDPLTGKDDWKLVLYGHAHVHPLGPFGKPLSDLGAVQASGGMYAVSGSSSSGGSAPTAAASAASDSMGFGSSMSSSFGSSMSSGIGSPMGGSPTGSPLGSSTSATPGGTTSSTTGSSSLGSPTSSGGGFQTNAPFVGVVPPIKGHSIVDYRGQNNYDRWEFNYDPIVDELRDKVSILGGSQSDLNGATSLNESKDAKKSSNSSNSLFGGNNLFGGSNSNSGTNSNSGNSSGSGNSSSSGSSNNSGNSDSTTPQ